MRLARRNRRTGKMMSGGRRRCDICDRECRETRVRVVDQAVNDSGLLACRFCFEAKEAGQPYKELKAFMQRRDRAARRQANIENRPRLL